MELVRTVLRGFVEVYWAIVDVLEPSLRRFLEWILDVEIRPGGASTLSAIVVASVGFWLASKLFLGITKSSADQPQKVVHTTDKTPSQVVREDLQSRFLTLLVLAALVAAVYLVAQRPS